MSVTISSKPTPTVISGMLSPNPAKRRKQTPLSTKNTMPTQSIQPPAAPRNPPKPRQSLLPPPRAPIGGNAVVTKGLLYWYISRNILTTIFWIFSLNSLSALIDYFICVHIWVVLSN
jgi:hypothetical protein